MKRGSNHYRDLEVWRRAIELAKNIYALTESFPKSEIYGLTSQIRRAAVSIPSNIAEGQTRNSPKEFRQFLSISLGSVAELETQLIIAKAIGYIEEAINELLQSTDSITRMTKNLIKSLNTRNPKLGTGK